MSTVNYRIAQNSDIDTVFAYESKKTLRDDLGEIENQILIWNSYFRKEALEHYFKLGWSFLGFNESGELVGFFMGQPLLFFEKQTQSLWVEHISADNMDIYTELVDIAYRLSREKHFQKVLFSKNVENEALTKEFPFKDWERSVTYLKTTK